MTVPAQWVSLDPGDRYCGWVDWEGFKPVFSAIMSPEETVERLESSVCKIEVLVFEKFSLYAWNEKSLAGNEFRTSQLIGAVKYICNRAGVVWVAQSAAEGKSTYRREPFKHWKTRDWKQALGTDIGSGHSRDALAHGYEYLRKQGFRLAA